MNIDDIQRLEFKIDLILKMLLDTKSDEYYERYSPNISFNLMKEQHIDDILKLLEFKNTPELNDLLLNIFSKNISPRYSWWEKGINFLLSSNDQKLNAAAWKAIQKSVSLHKNLPESVVLRLQEFLKVGNKSEKLICLNYFFEMTKLRGINEATIPKNDIINFLEDTDEELRFLASKIIIHNLKEWPSEIESFLSSENDELRLETFKLYLNPNEFHPQRPDPDIEKVEKFVLDLYPPIANLAKDYLRKKHKK